MDRSASHRGTVLTRQQARDIFEYKKRIDRQSSHALSTLLSKVFGISSKAVRDIWSGRCWLDATFDLWGSTERPTKKILGRPKGRKDSKPRKSKSTAQLLGPAPKADTGLKAKPRGGAGESANYEAAAPKDTDLFPQKQSNVNSVIHDEIYPQMLVRKGIPKIRGIMGCDRHLFPSIPVTRSLPSLREPVPFPLIRLPPMLTAESNCSQRIESSWNGDLESILD